MEGGPINSSKPPKIEDLVSTSRRVLVVRSRWQWMVRREVEDLLAWFGLVDLVVLVEFVRFISILQCQERFGRLQEHFERWGPSGTRQKDFSFAVHGQDIYFDGRIFFWTTTFKPLVFNHSRHCRSNLLWKSMLAIFGQKQ